MNGYISRLIDCGIPKNTATQVYSDFVNNFSLVELEVFIRYIEEKFICG